jgi:aspartate aminotransferase-like enzyme
MLTFRIARDRGDFELIHSLNHRTFVEEIPQHPPSPDGRLVDRFHDANTYVICKRGEQLAGMVAVNGTRPFSLDAKVRDLDAHLPPARRFCEVRLLAVEREFRSGRIFKGLAGVLRELADEHGFDGAVISGTTRQLALYRHLGFVPFGPLVGSGDALFQPMYLTVEAYDRRFGARHSVNLLPGPVAMSAEVRTAHARPAQSHRAAPFLASLAAVRTSLQTLTHAEHVAVALGSGTLANDIIAAQLTLLGGRGVVVSNGEFGERLADHASRAGLTFAHVRFDWGAPLDLAAVAEAAQGASWLWAVHCETSTGVCSDLDALRAIARDSGAKLCVDAISSLGLVAVDLRGVYLASSVSGKALGAFPGLALVFHDHDVAPSPSLPRYLDLGLYAQSASVPFTHSSNLVGALHAALARLDLPAKQRRLAAVTAHARSRLRDLGFVLVANDADAAPGIITVALPASAERVGAALERRGVLVSHRSDYLRTRNWIQFCFFTEEAAAGVDAAIDTLWRVH